MQCAFLIKIVHSEYIYDNFENQRVILERKFVSQNVTYLNVYPVTSPIMSFFIRNVTFCKNSLKFKRKLNFREENIFISTPSLL